MRKLFGTDGVRGVANLEPMTSETAMKLGRAAAYLFKRRSGRHQIVIGKDTRLSGYMLESALTSGICSMGVDVLLVGPMPTPAIAFLTRSLRADAGVVISASHNPYQDNGIKFFSNDGFKLPDEFETRMESLIVSDEIEHLRPTADDVGKAFRIDDAEGRYIEFVKRSLPRDLDFQGLRVVVDCANGAAYKVSPKVLRELGATVWVIGNEPDGMNINAGCGTVHPERLQEAVLHHQAHVGIAHDGDADRAVFVCEQGRLVDGDHTMAMTALDMQQRGLETADVGRDRDEQFRARAGHGEGRYHVGANARRRPVSAGANDLGRLQLRRRAVRTPDIFGTQHHGRRPHLRAPNPGPDEADRAI